MKYEHKFARNITILFFVLITLCVAITYVTCGSATALEVANVSFAILAFAGMMFALVILGITL